MKRRWKHEDNSMAFEKALMRIKYLPKEARVLDLFCGNGEMYKRAYKGRVVKYHGIDKKKVHDYNICELQNNLIYIKHNDLSRFNVFDLDDYGSPWKQLYMIIRKLPLGEYTFFITDGLVMHQKMTGKVAKFVSGTERVPQETNIPGANRFYVDMFGTMLKDLERRYGCEIMMSKYFHNERRTVYYWAVKIKKHGAEEVNVYSDVEQAH
jgi:hypothetical protein